jgi:hypothetical protein
MVFVEDQQVRVAIEGPVLVVAEAEAEARVEPVVAKVPAIGTAADADSSTAARGLPGGVLLTNAKPPTTAAMASQAVIG